MATTPVDFSDLGGVQVSPPPSTPSGGGIDFSDLGGQQVSPATGAAQTPAKKSWLDQATDAAKSFWQQINPVSGVQGAAQAVNHPIKTYMADAGNRQTAMNNAESEFKKGNYAAGMGHALNAIIPFVGPQMEQAGNDIAAGNVGKGVGTSLGLGVNLAAPEVIKNTVRAAIPSSAGGAASRLYQSALKPSTTMSPAEVARTVQTGLESGVPVSAGGLSKVGDLIDDLNTKIAAQVASNPNAPINKFSVASRLGDTAKKFATQVNPDSDLSAISKSGNEFLENQPTNIPASQAQAMKQGTYQQLSSRAYGELGTATIESQKALARGLKEELANTFPELSGLNAQDSKLIGLQDALESSVKRIGNHQMLGIGTPLAAAGVKAATGSTAAAGITGVMKAILDDPFVKSRVAIALHRASKGGITIPMGLAKYQGYVDALGNASNAQAQGGQTTQSGASQ